MIIEKKEALRGELCVPGDKSISHRSVMFGALADGKTEAENFLTGAALPDRMECSMPETAARPYAFFPAFSPVSLLTVC